MYKPFRYFSKTIRKVVTEHKRMKFTYRTVESSDGEGKCVKEFTSFGARFCSTTKTQMGRIVNVGEGERQRKKQTFIRLQFVPLKKWFPLACCCSSFFDSEESMLADAWLCVAMVRNQM